MRYRILGKTGLKVSEVAFGGWVIGGNRFGHSLGSTDDATSLEALNRAYELGCNFFISSSQYGRGHSEALLGQALKGWQRDQVLTATQGGWDFSEAALAKAPEGKPNFSATHLFKSLEASLARLNLDTVDLYLLQTPPLEVILKGQVFETLGQMKAQGKTRFVGVSIQDPQEGIQAIRIGQVDVIMAPYNLFDTRADRQLFQACEETGTGLLIREPLARGFLSGAFSESVAFEKGDVRAVWPKPLISKRVQAAQTFHSLLPPGYRSLAQFALAYTLSNDAVSSVIPDCRNRQEVEENMTTTELEALSEETRVAIRKLQSAL